MMNKHLPIAELIKRLLKLEFKEKKLNILWNLEKIGYLIYQIKTYIKISGRRYLKCIMY